MSLRVVAGEFKGRKLATVEGKATRPLLARVREAIFNVLGERVRGARVLDLFAGTGATGIEALSRGASRVVFVERAAGALRVLERNLEIIGLGTEDPRASILRADAWSVDGDAADLCFLDPPYAQVETSHATARVGELVASCGLLVFHFRDGTLDADDLAAFGEVDLRTWGDSAVAFVSAHQGRAEAHP